MCHCVCVMKRMRQPLTDPFALLSFLFHVREPAFCLTHSLWLPSLSLSLSPISNAVWLCVCTFFSSSCPSSSEAKAEVLCRGDESGCRKRMCGRGRKEREKEAITLPEQRSTDSSFCSSSLLSSFPVLLLSGLPAWQQAAKRRRERDEGRKKRGREEL